MAIAARSTVEKGMQPHSACKQAADAHGGARSSGDKSRGGLLTTSEAASLLRFRSGSGVREAVRRGELQPAGAG